jgi:hypothetical protein
MPRGVPEGGVTYRHYWTDADVGAPRRATLDDGEGDDTALYHALKAKIEECEMLRGLLQVCPESARPAADHVF